MDVSAFQSVKLAIMSASGLPRDALHVHIGLLVFFGVALVLRRPVSSLMPWLAVFGVAAGCEAIDAFDDLRSRGYWRWDASLHDVINTMVWPSVILLLARFTHAFRQQGRK